MNMDVIKVIKFVEEETLGMYVDENKDTYVFDYGVHGEEYLINMDTDKKKMVLSKTYNDLDQVLSATILDIEI